MNDAPLERFIEAIQATHGAQAQLTARERVNEQFEGETVWEGEVLVFSLADHPEASVAYCWEIDGRITAVLGIGPVDSPIKAVRASILARTK